MYYQISHQYHHIIMPNTTDRAGGHTATRDELAAAATSNGATYTPRQNRRVRTPDVAPLRAMHRLLVVVVEQVVERVVAALLHDAVELLRVDLAVAVAVRLVDHVLELPM